VAKARRIGDDLLDRGRGMLERSGLEDFTATDVEVLGSEETYGPHARGQGSREVVLKIGVHHQSREAVNSFVREIPSIALAGPPGVAGGGAGLPRPTPLIRMHCFPVRRGEVETRVEIDGVPIEFEEARGEFDGQPPKRVIPAEPYQGSTETVPLIAMAHGRSGDKGADANVGIRARHPDFWPVLLRELTPDRVASQLSHLGATAVERFELPGIHALNFLLHGALGAGGAASLRFDPQGKALAQQLLDMDVEIPQGLVGHHGMRPV
jgi:hypothetical protein